MAEVGDKVTYYTASYGTITGYIIDKLHNSKYHIKICGAETDKRWTAYPDGEVIRDSNLSGWKLASSSYIDTASVAEYYHAITGEIDDGFRQERDPDAAAAMVEAP